MINTDRVVPIESVDLLSMIGIIMALDNTSVTKASATTTGVFSLTSGSGNFLAAEPVKSLNFASAVTSAVVYFIPAFDYEGFSVNGSAVTTSGTAVDADSRSLYTATLSGGAVTIAKVGF